ncbi:hypothetical protein BDZ97DRAFT_2070662 [Flammula alnicola]|nr:hypothetical protein BDZ97DRAFT_2070662 [Flammula alnicola]
MCSLREKYRATAEDMKNEAPEITAQRIKDQRHSRNLEDFCMLHKHTITTAVSSALYLELKKGPFDFENRYLDVKLQERRPGQEDVNPATRFTVQSAGFRDDPTGPIEELTMEEKTMIFYRPSITEASPNPSDCPGLVGTVASIFSSGCDTAPYILRVTLMDFELDKDAPHAQWLKEFQTFINKGIVFRIANKQRHPGMMEMAGKAWVWKAKTLEELNRRFNFNLISRILTYEPNFHLSTLHRLNGDPDFEDMNRRVR